MGDHVSFGIKTGLVRDWTHVVEHLEVDARGDGGPGQAVAKRGRLALEELVHDTFGVVIFGFVNVIVVPELSGEC